jgi:hypothetical protein
MEMERRQATILYAMAKSMRHDLNRTEPMIAELQGRTASGISAFASLFNDLLVKVQKAVADDPISADALASLAPVEAVQDEMVRASVHKKKKIELLTRLGIIMAVLEPLASEAPVTVSMHATREGVFFAGEYFQPIRLLVDLIGRAKQSIVVIDGYLGDGQVILDVLTGKAKDVTAKILTNDVQPPLMQLA